VGQRRDQRSPEAAAYRRLYHTARWQRRRARQLAEEPLCRTCATHGRVTAASVADHVVPHKGNAELFHAGALASLCPRCHDGAKQSEERLGYSNATDTEGWPTDARHPANRTRICVAGQAGTENEPTDEMVTIAATSLAASGLLPEGVRHWAVVEAARDILTDVAQAAKASRRNSK